MRFFKCCCALLLGVMVSGVSLSADVITADKLAVEPVTDVLNSQQRSDMFTSYFERLSNPKPFKYTYKKDWEKRRRYLRLNVRKWLGLDPLPERVPLNVTYGGSLDRGDYVVRRVYYQTWQGIYASGWLYMPKSEGKHPAILNPHGHWPKGATDPMVQPRMITLAKKGYVALSVDAVHLRSANWCRAENIGICDSTLEIWNLIRGLDFLESLQEVDATRLGCTGASGGGLQTLYLMTMDDRLKAAVPAVYMSNARNFMYVEDRHCQCNYVPYVLGESDLPELAATFAPKPAFYTSVTQDWTVGVPKKEFPEIQAIYKLYDASTATGCYQWNVEHTYFRPMRERMYAWFNHYLMGIDDLRAAKEPEIQIETQETLRALDKWPEGAKGPSDAALDYYESRFTCKPEKPVSAADWRSYTKHLRASLVKLVKDPNVHGTLAIQSQPVEIGALKAEKLLIKSETDITVPAILAKSNCTGRQPVAIVLCPEGKAELFGAHKDLVDALVSDGVAVFAPDVRLTGELTRKWDHYAAFWGRPEVGMAFTDLKACLDVIGSRKDLDASRVVLVGIGQSGGTALFAAALEKRFSAVVIDNLGPNYVEGRIYPMVTNIRRVTDLPQIAAAIAPRCACIGGVGQGFDFVKDAYGAMGDEDSLICVNESMDTATIVHSVFSCLNGR